MAKTRKARRVAVLLSMAIRGCAKIMCGILDYAQEHDNWSLTIGPDPSTNPLSSLSGWEGDGAIMRLHTKHEWEVAKDIELPLVNLAAGMHGPGLPRVVIDHEGIGRIGAEYLLSRGLERFAFYTTRNRWCAELRRRGFVQRLAEAGHDCDVFEQPARFSQRQPWHAWEKRFAKWLRCLKTPVGLMAVEDLYASTTISMCHSIGLRVPDNVAVIGVDNDELICESAPMGVSSVAVDLHRLGYEAAALLDSLMSGKAPPPHDILIPPLGIVRRASTEMLFVKDEEVSHAMQFIQENIGKPFGVEAIEHISNISRTALENRFKASLNYTPYQYICLARVERAKQLLTGAEKLKLQQIARECGFSDVRRFRLVFRRLVGMAPASYRRAFWTSIPKGRRTAIFCPGCAKIPTVKCG